MNGRSTRDKIRWNVWRASNRIEEALGNLKHVEELAEGRSQTINEYMAQIVQALEACRVGLLDFRDQL